VVILSLRKIIHIQDITDIFIGMGAGLIAWLLTQGFATWLDSDLVRKISENLDLLDRKVKGLILKEKSRIDLGEAFYNALYANVNEAKICGIANRTLIESLQQSVRVKKGQGYSLMKSLMENENVHVKILFAHPDSEFVHTRDRVEESLTGRPNPCSNDIMANIERIKTLPNDENLKGIKFKGNNHLIIGLTKLPINLAITYAKRNGNDQKNENLLMGLVLHRKLGYEMPIYEIPREEYSIGTGLFKAVYDHFDDLFNDEEKCKKIFRWDKDGPEWLGM
jgi:hypothetical protein